jgi:Uma2 family endonuclease
MLIGCVAEGFFMQTATIAAPSGAPTLPAEGANRSEVIVDASIIIPAWVNELGSFRQWAHSKDYPQKGWIAYLNGRIWVDTSMEEFLTHNQVKFGFSLTIGNVLLAAPNGRFVADRMLLTNAAANLSTEPDGCYFRWATMQSGLIRLVAGKDEGYMELEGTPDMILEIVSKTSERKDKEVLRELYWNAGIAEYWLVDARPDPAEFDILRHTEKGYVATPAEDGWLNSDVLGRQFRLVRKTDPLGHPQFVVEVR